MGRLVLIENCDFGFSTNSTLEKIGSQNSIERKKVLKENASETFGHYLAKPVIFVYASLAVTGHSPHVPYYSLCEDLQAGVFNAPGNRIQHLLSRAIWGDCTTCFHLDPTVPMNLRMVMKWFEVVFLACQKKLYDNVEGDVDWSALLAYHHEWLPSGGRVQTQLLGDFDIDGLPAAAVSVVSLWMASFFRLQSLSISGLPSDAPLAYNHNEQEGK